MKTPSIDFDGIRDTVSLIKLVADDLGSPGRGNRWPCPMHGGEHPNFAITRDGKHWRCWSCGASGDVFDYLAKRENITLAEAARRLDPSAGNGSRKPAGKPQQQPAMPPPAPAWQDPAWQSSVDDVVHQAEALLWSKDGRLALDWLRARGLEDNTIRRFRIGFNPWDYTTEPIEVLGPDKRNCPQGLWVRRGIVIPWIHPASWYSERDDKIGNPGPRWVGVNIRRLAADFGEPNKPKYQCLQESERGNPYPWPEASAPGEPALLCEGEFDSLLAFQEVGDLLNVTTFGGAGQTRETAAARAFLSVAPDWLLSFDHDDAGDTAARAMARRSPRRCHRLVLPDGCKDVTDLWRSGRSVRDWLRDEYARLGWSWPAQDSSPVPAPSEPLVEVAP